MRNTSSGIVAKMFKLSLIKPQHIIPHGFGGIVLQTLAQLSVKNVSFLPLYLVAQT